MGTIRACIFDMDGLLIDSEDVITRCINELLARYGRPAIAREIRTKLMGVPDSTKSDTFHNWAKVPVPREQFDHELDLLMKRELRDCDPMPGAKKLLFNLAHARNAWTGESVRLGLASGTKTRTFAIKTSRAEVKEIIDFFEPEKRILGDDHRLRQGRGKPATDIYLTALQILNSDEVAREREGLIRPDECLVFEDSVIGIEAARRAGMRVVWVPHPEVAAEMQGFEREVLAGRTDPQKLGEEQQLGEIDGGHAEIIPSLDQFDFSKYAIEV